MLWSQWDRYVIDAERMKTLRDKTIKKIPLKIMKNVIQFIIYVTLL